jgi:PleD family two-component response regulator
MRRILIVDDEEFCATTVEIALLTLQDVEVQWAASAAEALRVFQSGWGVWLIVTDLHLPDIDGFELIARIRSDSSLAHVPIVVISGDPDPGAEDRALHLGADAYFCKPYSTAVLCQRVERLLKLRTHAASA